MIITIANEKGGIEKSILADNLAALRAMDGRNVLLLDADPQKFSLTWSGERGAAGIMPKVPARAISGKGLQPELENLTLRYNDIVIDTEGRDSMGSRSALALARIVIIPIRPDQIDLASEKKLIARIDTARLSNPRLRVLFVIACVKDDPSVQEIANARSLVAKVTAATLADAVIHEQTAILCAFKEGLSVSEYKPADMRSIAEMMCLYREVFKN
jgi:chromosome partitioning protein